MSTFGLEKIAKGSAVTAFLFGSFSDLNGLTIYYAQGQHSYGAVTPNKAGVNFGVAAYSWANPLFGLTGGTIYFAFEELYPGGMEGYLNDSARINAMNQAIVPGFNIYRTYP